MMGGSAVEWKGANKYFQAITVPHLNSLGQGPIHSFIKKRKHYEQQVAAQDGDIVAVSIMSTIDPDLLENSLMMGLFKPVVTMDALADDIIMTYLQFTQENDALLSADDLLTQIKATCTC
jgi:hypothetical protein